MSRTDGEDANLPLDPAVTAETSALFARLCDGELSGERPNSAQSNPR